MLTKGAVKVEVYHNTQLGDAVANVQSVRNGTIGFTTVSASNLNQVVPAMDMYSLPFLFKNEAHFWWFLAQPQAAELAKQMEDKGIKIIGYIDSGSRNFFTQKAVRTPDDLKGQKIRVMASPVMVNTMKALGATGVPVAWAELYTALQTGVVDGAENNHPSVVAKKFYEVSKYYTLDEHMRIPDVHRHVDEAVEPAQRRAEEGGARGRRADAGLYARRLEDLRGEGSAAAQEQVHRDHHARQGAVREGGVGAGAGGGASGSASRRRSPSSSTARRTSERAIEAVAERGRRAIRRPSHVGGDAVDLLDLLDRFVVAAGRDRAPGLHRAGDRAVHHRRRGDRRALRLRPGGVLDRGSAALSPDLDLVPRAPPSACSTASMSASTCCSMRCPSGCAARSASSSAC